MRALLRLGRREAWRHKLRSTMVIVLIALPVAMGTFALVLMPEWIGGSDAWYESELGDAQLSIMSTSPTSTWTPETEMASLGTSLEAQAGTIVDGSRFTLWLPRGGDLVADVPIEQVDAEHPLIAARFSLADGRLPAEPGEVAIAEDELRRAGVEVGDTVNLSHPDLDLVVVGTLEPRPERNVAGVVAPGTLERPALPTEDDPFPVGWVEVAWNDVWYFGDLTDEARLALMSDGPIDGQDGSNLSVVYGMWMSDPVGQQVESRAWVVAGGAFLLLWTGLVAASGLAVGARRRKRELGLLAADGADPRQLRVAVVAEGLVLGLVGATVGVASGLVGVYAIVPAVASRVSSTPLVLATELDPVWLTVLWSVGVIAAALAARAAASGLTTMSTSQLLRGQRPPSRPAPAWFGAGVVAFTAGCLILWAAASDPGRVVRGQLSSLVIASGVLLVTVGVIAVVVGATRLGGRLTNQAPISVRLAGRDLARQGVRVAAATAAVAVTLTGTMAIATYYHQNSGDIEAGRRTTAEIHGFAGPELTGGAAEVAELYPELSRVVDGRVRPLVADAGTAQELARAGYEVGTLVRIDAAATGLHYCTGDTVDTPVEGSNPGSWCEPSAVTILDDTTVAMMPDEIREALRAGRPVLNSGIGELRDEHGVDLGAEAIGFGWNTSDRYWGSESGRTMVTTDTAAALGVVPLEAEGTTLQLHVDLGGLDTAERDAFEEFASDLGFGVSIGTWNSLRTETLSTAAVVAIASVAVAAVTLLIVMVTLALVRVESRGDDEVLLVAGAAPGLVRRVNAARAGLIVVAAAIPGVVGGWWVARSLMRGDVGVPWLSVALMMLALPLLAAACGALTGRAPRHLRLT